MKKIISILLVGAAILACSKEKAVVDSPVAAAPSDVKTITVSLPASLSKVAFSPAAEPDGGVALSWAAGDKIRIISGSESAVYEIQPGFEGHTASFSGPSISGSSFTIIYPADFESESAAAAGDPFANQVQNGNGSTDGLKYVAVLSGVDSFEDIQFNDEWATAHGGSFRQNGVVRIREQFPADVKSVDKVFMHVKVGTSSMGWISLDFPGGADISSDHILTAYAALPLGDMAIPAAVSIDLAFATGNYDTYTRTLSFESLNLLAGKVNTFNLDKSKLTLQPFYDGAGTETRPYLIGNARQLGNIEAVLVASEATTVNYFKLISDIDLAGNDWDTIVANPYKLIHFDGDNHVIKNMKTVNGGSYEGGFIGILYGTLKNVTFEKVDVTSNSNPSGAVCCWAGANDETTWGVLENVHVKGGSVTQNVVQQMGGIAGKARNASFTNCSVEDVILTATTCSTSTGDNGYGGIAGWAHTSTFTGCEFKNSTLNGGRLAGGIIGYAPTAVTVENCLSSGTIKAKKMNNRNGEVAGGIVGWWGGTALRNCTSTADISTENNSAAGIVGQVGVNNLTVEKCAYKGGKVASGAHYAGGIVAYANPNTTVKECYSGGTVSSTSNHAGGIVGFANTDVTVKDCYSIGSINCGAQCGGGIVGELSSGGSVSNCYSMAAIGGQRVLGGIVGRACNAAWDVTVASNNTVTACIAWNPSIICTDTRDANSAGGSGTIVGFTSVKNTLSKGYRNSNIDYQPSDSEYAGHGVDQPDCDGTNWAKGTTPGTGKKYQCPYHGTAAAATATVTSLATSLGWDTTVWNLTGDRPTLKANPES